MVDSLRVLYIANKTLPLGDYRIRFGAISKTSVILYGVPGKTEGIADSSYVHMAEQSGRVSAIPSDVSLALINRGIVPHQVPKIVAV